MSSIKDINDCAEEIEEYLLSKGFKKDKIIDTFVYCGHQHIKILCISFNWMTFPVNDGYWKQLSYDDPSIINNKLIERIFPILRKYDINKFIIYGYDNNKEYAIDPSIEYRFNRKKKVYEIGGINIDYTS